MPPALHMRASAAFAPNNPISDPAAMHLQTSTRDLVGDDTRLDALPCREGRPDSLAFSGKLYGRAPQLEDLAASHALARVGRPSLLLVTGGSGVGKTALVLEARRSVFPATACFLHGKFDQYERDTPYSGILAACKGLVQQLPTTADRDCQREQIQAAVAPHGQLLVDVLPELAPLLGPQPPLPDLPPNEHENRFRQVFRRFIGVFARQQNPLILFVDDLQWADPASLHLIQTLLTDERQLHLAIIGAYRDNEVTGSHPLLQTVAELRAAKLPVQTIALAPLAATDLRQWCMELLDTDREQAQLLSQVLLQKTDGSPFFVRQFLLFCRRQQLLLHDADHGGWQWDLDAISQCEVTDNVADLMARRLGTLNPETRELLSIAACLGDHFDTRTLAQASGHDLGQVMTALCEALLEKLIALKPQPTKSDHAAAPPPGLRCRFLHDRIRQAAYARLTAEEQARIHLRIGNLLLIQRTGRTGSGDIFEIVNHLNAGTAQIHDEEEQLQLAALNLTAGEKAKAAAAYGAATQYLSAGLRILPPAGSGNPTRLHYDLQLALAECAYGNGDFAAAEQAFDDLLTNTQSPLLQAKVYKTKVVLYEHLGNPRQALQCALTGMKLLDFEIKTSPLWWRIVRELLPLKRQLRGKGLARLQDLKPMWDRKMILAMDIAHKAIPAAYFLDTRLVILLSLQMSALSLRHGHTNSTPVAFATLGVLWGSFLGDYQNGARIGEIALRLSEHPAYRDVRCKTNFIVGNYIAGWSAGSGHALALMQKGVREGVASGETTHLTYCAVNEMLIRFTTGAPLVAILDNNREYEEIFAASRYHEMTSIAHALKQNIDKLRAAEWDGIDASDSGYNEPEYLARIEPQAIRTTLYLFYFHKMVVHTIFNHYDLARQTGAKIARNIEEVLFGSPQTAYFFLYYGISITMRFQSFPLQQRAGYLFALLRYRRKMRRWAASCPGNFRHQSLLLDAETARITGRTTAAATLYDKAIAAAQESGALHHTALANELAAMMHLANHNEPAARRYLAAALDAYQDWGARAKVNQLKATFPHLL